MPSWVRVCLWREVFRSCMCVGDPVALSLINHPGMEPRVPLPSAPSRAENLALSWCSPCFQFLGFVLRALLGNVEHSCHPRVLCTYLHLSTYRNPTQSEWPLQFNVRWYSLLCTLHVCASLSCVNYTYTHAPLFIAFNRLKDPLIHPR